MPTPQITPDPRLLAAEARFHAAASNLERASLDAVDQSGAITGDDLDLTREERIGRAVASAVRRYQEAHRAS